MNTTMSTLQDAARAAADNASLRDGYASGTIAGHQVTAWAIPTRTNGRVCVSVRWGIDGRPASKSKVAALAA